MASSSSSSSSSFPSVPAFSSQLWKYHVFLSFRGEDTRKTFVDHLYSSLEQQGIYTYKDDATLPRGESIGPSLMKAIEESQIVIIVFSKNYADSSWCLDELAYIMKCKDTRGQIVMPIFYDVCPSIVRKQKKKYGKAFAKHELENKNNVESWRKALVEASNLSGWEPRNIANGHESVVIKEIVDTISQRLCLLTSNENENLIGIETRTKDLKSKLEIGSGGVRMIGIWGVGGGGKTTLAFSVYNEICSEFDGCCFLENIREESRRYGLEILQDKILSNVLKQKEIEVNGVGGGRWLINNRLRHRKVLIVLDDVDHLDQLKALAGSHYWFGEGSRIIIATRNEHLLIVHKVNVIHNISLLNEDEALNLLWKHALRDHQPTEDYELLSKDVVSYACGLPLALTTLGSFLCDKNINEWMSALARLKEIPDSDIVGKLKISFDGLTPIEKELFLDIACFFRREKKDEAMKTLHASGLHPVIGVKVLIQKALITISNGMFDMHDLVQEMGHCIVRGEHPNNPEKHSRIWKKEDVLKICAMDATTELNMTEAIKIKCSGTDSLQRLPLIIANMKNLKRINWEGDMASPLPTNFSPGKLCCLKMEGISQKRLWEGYKCLPNLKIMELCGLRNLIMTPNFDGLPNLERFKLTECWHIEEIHPSIGRLERLVFLAIEGCIRLKMFPRITRLKKLETLQFSGCPKLFDPSKIQQNLDNLQHLRLDNSEAKAASYMKSCTNFFGTWWCYCSNVRGYTEIKDLTDVEESCLEEPCLPYNVNHIIGLQRGLKKLNLSFCNLVDEVISSAAVWDSSNLEELDLTGNNFSRLNFGLLKLFRLKRLNVSRCEKLVELSGLPSSIAVVIADDCTSLETLGDISNCKWLWKLALRGGNKLSAVTSDAIINSMFKGNAIGHHFISVTLPDQVFPPSILGRLYRRETFTLHLPSNWHIDFCGFVVRIATKIKYPNINIVIKSCSKETIVINQDPGVSNYKVQLSYKHYGSEPILVGYVSFSSLMHTTFLNSSYNTISISLNSMYWSDGCVGAELVPRKTESDLVQTTKSATNCSEFWDNEKTFMVEHNSKSSIEILWSSSECT